ncbi:DUF2059 domain-containing protein [Terasakiella sp. A23]|uniref:DUF2059 domain-containing protein n=1 Tax=Terasakiella sp. FCG-A23 TaxID=3080561 RepID=UPI0029539D07|nr:DUF2059 domain-containing protein [Terasakiella sp. A23]MDV7339732.1 DUF2059 domain-containing protein [Terasakiella sp. A23]
MRFLIMSLSLLSFLVFASVTQAADANKRAKIIEMIEASGAMMMMDEAVRAVVPEVLKQIQAKDSRLTQEHANAIAKAMGSEMRASKGSFFDMMVPIYDKVFTLEEIEHAIAYYKSPLGRSIVQKSSQILQPSLQVGQKWSVDVGQRAAKRAFETAKELGYKI